jgi:hypothetical protein
MGITRVGQNFDFSNDLELKSNYAQINFTASFENPGVLIRALQWLHGAR